MPAPKKQFEAFEKEYASCIDIFRRTGVITPLPKTGNFGVLGVDKKEYPVPTWQQIKKLFAHNKKLVERKLPQGFNRLELTPIAMPTRCLVERMRTAILGHAMKEKIYQTRRTPKEPFTPVRVNSEKTVWIWETLKEALDTDKLVYFLKDYSDASEGETKSEAVNDARICALPGWSVGLVESLDILPKQGKGKKVGGRKQLEVGLSPREYLEILQGKAYEGETGKTLEDFIIEFLIHLEETNEISHDASDNNALWCLGQYMKISYAEVVPAGRWIRDLGRARLDMHRTGNKFCTKNVGASTVVRLLGP